MSDHVGVSCPLRTALPAFAAPALLVFVGTMLALSIVLSKTAAGAGAPMLTYLAAALGGSGVFLTAIAAIRGKMAGAHRWLGYAAGAGVFMAGPSALGYLSVAHVGAGFVSLTFAFPVLLTWVLTVALRMDRLRLAPALGVAAGLTGGLILALGKLSGAPDPADSGWTLMAAAIPFTLALGNIYRTRFWPPGAASLPLAALTLLFGAVLTMPFAIVAEGVPKVHDLLGVLPILLTAMVVIAAQMVMQFRLQDLAGPVYMSQIGSVAAIVGATVAVSALGEALPRGFWAAALLIAIGATTFQYARRQA